MALTLDYSDTSVLKQRNGNIYLASEYLPFDSQTLPLMSELQRLVSNAKQAGNGVIKDRDYLNTNDS